VTVEVGPDQTIANVLLAHGVDVITSCEQGVCGACLTPVLEGIPDHRDAYQTEDEKAGNTHVTICCSRARTKVLVLDI
jgi:vanillate O-demethylase ferredoxin subunit